MKEMSSIELNRTNGGFDTENFPGGPIFIPVPGPVPAPVPPIPVPNPGFPVFPKPANPVAVLNK